MTWSWSIGEEGRSRHSPGQEAILKMDRARPTDGRFVAFESNSQSASFDVVVVVVSSTTPQIRFARAGFNETVGCWMNGGELARRLQLQRDCIGGRKSEMIRMIPACNTALQQSRWPRTRLKEEEEGFRS